MDKYTIDYNDNEQVKELIEQVIKDNILVKTGVAKRLGISAQNFAALMNKKNINLDDLSRIMNAIGYDVSVTVKRKR